MLIVCNGMIRSGSTIQYNLVRGLVEAAGRGVGRGFFSHEAAADAGGLRALAAAPEWSVIKSHRHDPCLPTLSAPGDVRVCCTYRHPLDAAGSAKTKFGWPWGDVLDNLAEGIRVHESAIGVPGALVQRYEDLIEDLPAATRLLDAELGVGAGEEAVRAVAAANGIDAAEQRNAKLRPAAKRRAWVKSTLRRSRLLPLAAVVNRQLPARLRYGVVVDPQTQMHPDHISANRGVPGASRASLTAEESAEVGERFGAYIQEHYPHESGAVRESTGG